MSTRCPECGQIVGCFGPFKPLGEQWLKGKLADLDAAGIEEPSCIGSDQSPLPTARQVPEWIAVSERLPEPNVCVLTWSERGGIGWDAYDEGGWIEHENTVALYEECAPKDISTLGSFEPTHWQPLPTPPASDTTEEKS
jgi:hypothetical protein